MSLPWLDDLSEEWIPQPAPPTATNDLTHSVSSQSSQSVPPKPRSRLPRMRQSSGSFSEISVRHIAKDLCPPKRRSALAERSLSDNNISLTTSADASLVASVRAGSQSFTAASLDSIVCDGTIAVTKSPSKEKLDHELPEWRRRLLKGDIGYGDQKDLFGPSGLENIFQRPSDNISEDQQPKRKLGLFKGLNTIPSSPPPWPSADLEEASLAQEAQRELSSSDNRLPGEDSVTQEAAPIQEVDAVSMTGRPANREAPRAVSGQTEFENENFSPVYLSTNLRIEATPGPIPDFGGSELASRLRQIGSPVASETSQHIPEDVSTNQSRADSSFARLQDDSLPEDLPAGTPDLAEVGHFVELRRGGYSRDGSFRRRPLSPSPRRPVTQSALRNESKSPLDAVVDLQATSDSLCPNDALTPRTPHRRGPPNSQNPERTKSSGSPLKLFDAHDTFTSNRLQRRLSQLEYKSDKTASTSMQISQTEVTKLIQKTSRLTSVDEVSFQKLGAADDIERAQQEAHRVETFGEGQLNEYQFSGDCSTLSSQESEDLSAPDGSPSMDVPPPGSRQPLAFSYDASPISREPSKAKRQGLTRVMNPFRTTSHSKPQSARRSSSTKQQELLEADNEYADGKRGPTSPFKNPTPKRRRTIHLVGEDEDDAGDTRVPSIKDSHLAMQSVIGRKRKDARHEHSANVADPEVLARRHILRPRNPTPSQRRLDDIHDEILEATEAFIHSSPKMNIIREHIDLDASDAPSEEARAAIVANEVAAFSMKRQVMRDESRKKSVTTQDFLDEAVKIMDFIRAKGRPTSGLGSLEESESESHLTEEKNGYPSSSLTFDRPPSREGRLSAWKEPNKHELDPQVMSHLRKFQERESDDLLGSSFRSLRFSRMRGPASPEGESVVVEQDDIRITDNPNRPSIALFTDDDRTNSQPRTNATHPSTGSSMGQTVATSTSRRSDHVATLAPEAVAHLIPEKVAGMSFDREKGCWKRDKTFAKEHHPVHENSANNESEDDPFGNIPDLTVDETVERLMDKESPSRPQATAETFLEDTEEAAFDEKARPVTREGKGIALTDTSSVPSKVSNFAWSFPKTETRATSWSDQETRNGGTQKFQQPLVTYAIPESEEDDVEHEIQYFEGRGTAKQGAQAHRVRDITISIAERDFANAERPVRPKSSPLKAVHQRWTPANQHQQPSANKTASSQINCARTLPNGRKIRRPIFEDNGDLPILEDLPPRNYRMQVSMSVAAPVSNQADALLRAPSSPTKADVTFMLSDLPEFTLNQIDECELPNRVVVKHDGQKFSQALEDRYALSTAELVKALQDVEPDEPYWEDLREVSLHDKSLTNLHRLDDFCCRLEELDISKNRITQVKGVPCTIRRLQAQNNCLTGLTSWMSLMNLQHLDVSRNDIDSLDGLGELVHLRTLKANDNKIKSLDGILHLDGLIELAVARNEVEAVDFATTNLKSLTEVDLRGNLLYEIRNVHCLPLLQHLNLDNNCVEEFPLFDMPAGRCKALRSLRLCGNGTTSLDVDEYFPRLESLYVDRNSLTNVSGLEHLRHLRTFSARDQTLESDSDAETCVGNLVRNPEVRNLYISLNPTIGLQIPQHLLSLQRLELASMGLKELPNDFGQLTPNIRSINLNFNAIQDLRPLLNIKRLDELLLAGNKVERLRASALVLQKLATLSRLDWRDNPLTIRFHAPASENRIMSLRQKPSDEQSTDRFILPNGDVDADEQYLQRLDYETKIRRRVNEMMLANLCVNLQELNGLPFDKTRILVKDDIWERLLYLGVIQRKQADTTNDGTEG